MRKALLVFGVTAAAVVLASCRAEVNIALDVEEDGSGVMAFELGLDEELRELMGSTGADPDDLFGDIESDLEEGTVTQREEGDMSFQGVEIEFDDIDEVTGFLTDSSSDFFGGFGTLSFELDETSAVFDATLLAEEQDLGDFPFDPSQFTGDFLSANFILTMPGTVTVHNADEVLADGRLRWDLPLLGGEIDLHAESEFGGSGFPWLILILGIVLLIGATATVAAVIMGRRQEKQAVSDAAAAYPQTIPIATDQQAPDAEPDSTPDD